MSDLLVILSEMLPEFNTVYLVIDALDECADLVEVLSILDGMQTWVIEHLHIILTSRRLPEIEEVLSEFTTEVISICESPINKDILLYIAYCLETDRSLAKWPSDIRLLIQNTLSRGADGMCVK